MDWTEEDRGEVVVVAPGESINHVNADEFDELLTPAVVKAGENGQSVVIDLTQVDYMSSVGLRVLMRAHKKALGVSISVAVSNLNRTMREIFEISRFDKIFVLHDSVDAAVDSLSE